MIEYIWKRETDKEINPKEIIRGLTWNLVIATLILMAIGSATRVMNAGLACPDWPLCYGEILPVKQMNLRVFLEWFHRLDASLIGIGAIALTTISWWKRKDLPQWLPITSSFALFLVIFQGILGGLTVIELLRFDIVTAHLGTALLFFTTLLVIYMALLPYQSTGNVGKLPLVSLIAAILIYGQSLLGGLVGSQWALHQCLNYAQLCTVMHSHLGGVVPATLAVLTVVIMAWRNSLLNPLLKKLAMISGGLVILQILLGLATFWLHLQVETLTVAHQTVGALLLGTLVAFNVLTWRENHLTISE